ncbi:MAG: glycine--tRNA ligase subunit beta, partial [Candidatus Acidiferrales bacterium]
LARQNFGRRADNELLEQLVNLVEHPAVLLGNFEREYLKLPAQVLVTVMRHHQKYFSVEDGEGKLAPRFLAVIDLDADRNGQIRRNHEAVLAARFRDAQFFWAADQRRPLAERLPLLEQTTFVARAGNYRQKVNRLLRLAGWLGENVSANGRRADIAALARAAELSKSDLTTEMVGEFPELQGVIGGLYARAQGEPEAVAAAIFDHHKPAGPEDSLPATLEGALLAVADKLDSLAACFAVGLVPTGSRDPYALRRAAAGIVRIVTERQLRLRLSAASGAAVSAVREGGLFSGEVAKLAGTVLGFLEERARHLFRESLGFAYDEVNAVFAAGWDDLVDARARLEALRQIRPTPDFEPLAAAFKRIRNILEQAGGSERFLRREIDPGLVEAGPERDLHDRFLKLKPRVAVLREEQRYPEALRAVASLRPQVDRFFDKVLVMAPDEALRENRLALLAHLLREFSAMADFSEIVVATKEKET